MILLLLIALTPMETVGALSRDIGPRPACSDTERMTADWIAERLHGLGYSVALEQFPVGKAGVSRNVVAHAGAPPYMLIGAHYDTLKNSPGADDNASGVAVALELARQLRDHDRGLLFVFFGAEERVGPRYNDHHYGSRFMASRIDPRSIELMLSIDMVGNGSLILLRSLRRHPGLLPFEQAGRELKLRAAWRSDTIGMSDHEAFEKRGIPSIWVERYPAHLYHSPRDRTVRPERIEEVIALLERAIRSRKP